MDVTDERNRFEVRLFIKLTRNDDSEIDDLAAIESEIIAQLEAATLADKQIVLEQKTWNRGQIARNDLNVHGIQSTLTVIVLEKKSTSGSGIIGSEMTLSIGTISNMIILGETGGEGRESGRVSDDTGITKVSKGKRTGQRFWEYEYTSARYSEIDTLIENDSEITATVTEKGVPVVYTIKPVFQRASSRFDGLKTVILQVEIV